MISYVPKVTYLGRRTYEIKFKDIVKYFYEPLIFKNARNCFSRVVEISESFQIQDINVEAVSLYNEIEFTAKKSGRKFPRLELSSSRFSFLPFPFWFIR